MTPEERAARIAARKAVIEIAEWYPEVPLPEITTYRADGWTADWYFYGAQSARRMALVEEDLRNRGCALSASSRRSGDTDRYELKGSLGDLAVTVSAPAALVAARKVTGTRTEEIVDWVRLPVEPGPESGES